MAHWKLSTFGLETRCLSSGPVPGLGLAWVRRLATSSRTASTVYSGANDLRDRDSLTKRKLARTSLFGLGPRGRIHPGACSVGIRSLAARNRPLLGAPEFLDRVLAGGSDGDVRGVSGGLDLAGFSWSSDRFRCRHSVHRWGVGPDRGLPLGFAGRGDPVYWSVRKESVRRVSVAIRERNGKRTLVPHLALPPGGRTRTIARPHSPALGDRKPAPLRARFHLRRRSLPGQDPPPPAPSRLPHKRSHLHRASQFLPVHARGEPVLCHPTASGPPLPPTWCW